MIKTLPNELISEILEQLDRSNIYNLRPTCRWLNAIIESLYPLELLIGSREHRLPQDVLSMLRDFAELSKRQTRPLIFSKLVISLNFLKPLLNYVEPDIRHPNYREPDFTDPLVAEMANLACRSLVAFPSYNAGS
ncbi:hypothetical protein BT96DRAFT_212126 [Gymnopus androsaceus JB14]|uniref:F-box domain-containing protein n=1 Tax=Gymnopus androsaceus JB14 TaxID=1447944 RepID=A0A6A4H8S3_9AGAR|nr:hypothetical protein BT96DRAFT_212126 [Gymnopus androsaceus JB14]